MAVGSVITGWGVGQYPWLLVDHVTVDDAAGADATLIGLFIVVALAGVIVLPALAYLFPAHPAVDPRLNFGLPALAPSAASIRRGLST